MEQPTTHILVVDDELLNLEILTEHLEDDDYIVTSVESAAAAWKAIESSDHRFSAILLDRMMPDMDGLSLLQKIKAHPNYQAIPVIMQTALADQASIDEGLHAGAYYYLTKPFEKSTLLAIVRAAIEDQQLRQQLEQCNDRTASALRLVQQVDFRFQNLDEASYIVSLLCTAYPEIAELKMALSELMINAIEHGNLEISYQDKTELNAQGKWADEVQHRLTLAAYKDRFASLSVQRERESIQFHIVDQGNGFDWADYLELSPARACDSHGRGIAMARMLCFAELEYRGTGNEVVARVKLK